MDLSLFSGDAACEHVGMMLPAPSSQFTSVRGGEKKEARAVLLATSGLK